jgi:hypothetical protein
MLTEGIIVDDNDHCALRWGWQHQPPVALMSTTRPGMSDVATTSAPGGGERKGSVDDCGEEDNDGDELDSGSGNATSSKEGTPLKCKG